MVPISEEEQQRDLEKQEVLITPVQATDSASTPSTSPTKLSPGKSRNRPTQNTSCSKPNPLCDWNYDMKKQETLSDPVQTADPASTTLRKSSQVLVRY